jgi:hypothetical protein
VLAQSGELRDLVVVLARGSDTAKALVTDSPADRHGSADDREAPASAVLRPFDQRAFNEGKR